MARTVLVPLDGSDASRAVLMPLQRLLAAESPPPAPGARVTTRLRLGRESDGPSAILLNVVHEEGSRGEREFGQARAYLESCAQTLELAGVRASPRIAHGDPTTQILDVARACGADLIALATHGRTGATRLVWGSVAESVLRRTEVPVLLVNPHQLRSVGTSPIRRLLVPIDGSASTSETLRLAAQIAAPRQAEVVVARVAPLEVQGDADAVRDAAGPLDAAQELLAARGISTVRRVLAFGAAGEGLLELVERERVDLVVMATHGRTGLARAFLGSVAEHVARRAIVPVLVHRVLQAPVGP